MDRTIFILICTLSFLIALLFGVLIFGIPGIGHYLTSLKLKEKLYSFTFLLILLSLVSIISINLTFIYIERSYSLLTKAIYVKPILSPSMLSEQSILESIIEADPKYESIVRGKIGYKIPDTMQVGQKYRATVTITKAQNDSILFINLDSTNFVKEEIVVSSKVKVVLIDPNIKNFDIVDLNTEEQFVNSTTNTKWFWNITPIRKGDNNLIVRATIKLISDLGETSKDITVFEKIIAVQASPVFSTKQFLGDNWQWIAGTLLIPLLVWRYSVRKRKKKPDKKTPVETKQEKYL